MALHQLEHTSTSINEGGFIHLEAIDVEITGIRPYSKFQIILEGISQFRHNSDMVENSLSVHWDCDIYIKSRTKAVLSVQYIKGLRIQRTLDKFEIDFGSQDIGPRKTVTRIGRESLATVELSFGQTRSSLDMARWLTPNAVAALGVKVAMLDKLDRVFKLCDLVLGLSTGASEVNPFAKTAVGIINKVFEKFRNIPSVHKELVSIMDNVAELLPIVELVLKHVSNVEVQGILQKFFHFVIKLAINLEDYASRPPLRFILRNWYDPRGDEIHQIKDQLTYTLRSLSLGLQANILSTATTISKRQLSEAEEKALERLWPPENSAYDPSSGCLSGTRGSVLRNIKEWAYSRNHSQQIYWVHGVAGCGKSSVAASVAGILDEQKILSGSFFCKRDIPERRSAGRLLYSLAYFLSRRVSAFRTAVLQQLRDDPVVLDKPIPHQFNVLLARPLATVPRAMGSEFLIIIVIDALDECEYSEIIAVHLASIVQAAPWLRLIVTSRPNPQIKASMLRIDGLIQECDLFAATTNDDILCFTRYQFNTNKELPNIDQSQIDCLARHASGHFIWTATVLKHVSIGGFGKKDLLQQIIDSNPRAATSEQHLDAVYLRVLEDACRGSVGIECAVRWVIGLIFAVSKNRPLPSKALHAFIPSRLGATHDELETILGHLGSVLYNDAQTGAIRVCHPSFLDFAGSQDRSGCFSMTTDELEKNMVENCLRIMLDGLKFNICKLQTSHLLNKGVLDLNNRVNCNIPQQLQYSCLYWFTHLSRSQKDGRCEEQMQPMLREFLYGTSLLYWLEALSVMSELKVAVITLKDLRYSKCFKNDKELNSIALDLYRFVTAFQESMAMSAPHIYLSALLWAPVKSMTANRYCGRKFNIQQCILKGVNDHWPTSLHTITTHSPVVAVAYSPDGRHIVSGSYDKTVQIWDAETGVQVGAPLEGHQNSVKSVAYSPDGRHIVSGSWDKTVRIWDAETGAQVGALLKGHQGWVDSVAYSPDGRHIVSGSWDKTVRIWDAETGAQVGAPLEGHQGSVNSVAYSPDGHHIVSGSSDNTVRIWDAETGAQVGTPLEGHQDSVDSVAYSPDGRHIVSGSFDNTVQIWDAETGAQVGAPLEGHQNWVDSVAYSPDGRHIVSGSFDNTVRIWDAETGAQVGAPLEGHQNWVDSVAYSPDGRHIVSGSWDKTVQIWDAETGAQVGAPLKGHQDSVSSVAYSPDGHHIVSGSSDNTVRIWDAETGAQVGTPLEGHQNWVYSVAYSPDRRHIVSGSWDNTVQIWDAETGAQVGASLEGHQDSVNSVAYSPDGRHIVSGSLDNTVRIWDAETGAQVGTPLKGHQNSVDSVAYSPDGHHIVSGSRDNTVRIWDAETGAQVGAPLEGHQNSVNSVAYSPDGRHIVSGSSDNTVRIWDAETGAQVGAPLEGHQNWVDSVAYSPDGRHIVSGSFDNTVRIWDAETGAQVGAPLEGHQNWVDSVAYSPDGRHIVSGSSDNTVRIWAAETGAQVGAPLKGHQEIVDSVAYSLDGRHIASGSKDRAVHICHTGSTIQSDGSHGMEGSCGAGTQFPGDDSESCSTDDSQETYSLDIDEEMCTRDVNGFVRLNIGGTGALTTVYGKQPSNVPVDGWIRTLTGGLLLWIPYEYRNGICDMSEYCFPRDAPGHPVRLDWSKLCHGDTWTKVKISDED